MRHLALVLLAVLFLPLPVWAADVVVVCPLTGMVDDGMAALVDRVVKESAGAQALLFEIDTPGGLIDSAIRISNSILGAPCRTIAYIHGMGAISAGALISYSCTDMIMAPGSNIGAATPVIASPEGMLPTGEKEVSFMRAKMRALAERTGRNPALAEAMVDKDIELRAYNDTEGKLQIYAAYPEKTGGKASEPSAAELAKDVAKNLPPELAPVKKLITDALPKSANDGAASPSNASEAGPPENPPQGRVISPTGKLLTLTPNEAVEYGLIPRTSATLADVLSFYGYQDAEVRQIEMSWAEIIFRFLTSPVVAGLLLLCGIGGVYLEMKAPGLSVPGVIGVTCLILFFGSHMVLGIAQWIDVVLVVVGITLILVEVFVFPHFGALIGLGVLCMLAGIYMTLTTAPIPRYSWDYARLEGAMTSLVIALTSFTVLVYALWKVFPHTPLYGRFVLTYQQDRNKGYAVQTAEQHDAAIGLEGEASSMLRPAGWGRFGGQTYSVVTRGDFIEKGAPIIITEVDGNRYVVERLDGGKEGEKP